ncbi:hypothetical protein FIBSPDRAFT_894918 [Athelia psychrophila]|uniref:Uncharacterized protein n=1 Tax=Athelia psychrophila TaxID=1759441 RepID=A0A166FC35_9AGAM|nr:hypothetical protein FIBSPDRAFT_894918 [Fibularhizoctonia sp. CBS 109695]
MDLDGHWLFVLLGKSRRLHPGTLLISRGSFVGAMVKWIRDRFKALSRYARRNIRTEDTQQMGGLEEGPTEGVENTFAPPSINVAPLASSVEQLEQMDTGNTASADAMMGEHSESALFVCCWSYDKMLKLVQLNANQVFSRNLKSEVKWTGIYLA